MTRRATKFVPLLIAATLAVGGMLTGCPSTGVTCSSNLTACGTGCADFQNDTFNCGGCGSTCQETQICVAGVCQCQPGAVSCGGHCILPQTDPNNCGGCAGSGGVACSGGTPDCQAGACVATCTGTNLCGNSCVDFNGDPHNCGGCGSSGASHVCPGGESCHAGHCTWDVVASCSTLGEVAPLSAQDVTGPARMLGTAPGALAAIGETTLLDADLFDSTLHEAGLVDLGALAEAPVIGMYPNQVMVDDPYVYVVNSGDNTLQILQRNGVPPDAGGSDAGSLDAGAADAGANNGGTDGGLGLVTISGVNFGPNASPEWAVKLGSNVYVTLYGGQYPAGVAAGQSVARVDVSNIFAPVVAETIDLSGLPLMPFDGGVAIARPQQMVAQNGLLYAVLNNLDAAYHPAGPGLLARLDPVSRAVSTVALGPNCLNPVALNADTGRLFVLCAGFPTYNASFVAVADTGAELVLVSTPDGGAESVASSWTVACPPGSTTCLVPVPMALARVGSRIFVGDANGGRVFAVDAVGNQLVEHRGYADGGTPFNLCPIPDGGLDSNVGYLLAP